MRTAFENPRDVDQARFPHSGSFQDIAVFLLHYAVLAPSSHNTQPWLFEIHSDTIDLFADISRALPVVDPINRELVISCGAALGNLKVAANFFGFECVVELLPEKNNNNHLASIRLREDHTVTANDIRLFSAIKDRYTSRDAFLPKPMPSSLGDSLMHEASRTEIELHLITDAALRENIAALISEGDRIQFTDPAFRKELSQWIRSRKSGQHDGMSSDAHGSPDILSKMNAMIIRTFDIGNGVAANDKEIAETSPMLAVLATKSEEPVDWIATGELLSRLLLQVTASGVSCGYLNQPIEAVELRKSLCERVGVSGYPQLLLRLGKSDLIKPSVRRPMAEVTRVMDGSFIQDPQVKS